MRKKNKKDISVVGRREGKEEQGKGGEPNKHAGVGSGLVDR